MAALSITAANVVAGSNAKKTTGVAGASITAGQAVYLDTATGTLKLTDADGASALIRSCVGIALHAASANQPLTYQYEGLITIGATVAIGSAYFTSATAGGVAPVADNTTGVYPTFLGFATTAAILDLHIHSALVAVP